MFDPNLDINDKSIVLSVMQSDSISFATILNRLNVKLNTQSLSYYNSTEFFQSNPKSNWEDLQIKCNFIRIIASNECYLAFYSSFNNILVGYVTLSNPINLPSDTGINTKISYQITQIEFLKVVFKPTTKEGILSTLEIQPITNVGFILVTENDINTVRNFTNKYTFEINRKTYPSLSINANAIITEADLSNFSILPSEIRTKVEASPISRLDTSIESDPLVQAILTADGNLATLQALRAMWDTKVRTPKFTIILHNEVGITPNDFMIIGNTVLCWFPSRFVDNRYKSKSENFIDSKNGLRQSTIKIPIDNIVAIEFGDIVLRPTSYNPTYLQDRNPASLSKNAEIDAQFDKFAGKLEQQITQWKSRYDYQKIIIAICDYFNMVDKVIGDDYTEFYLTHGRVTQFYNNLMEIKKQLHYKDIQFGSNGNTLSSLYNPEFMNFMSLEAFELLFETV